jgi:beta-glucosidase
VVAIVFGDTVLALLAEACNCIRLRFSTVVQLYVAFPEHADEPPELLRGFTKVTAPAGGQAVASFSLDARALSVWNATPGVNQWCLVEGEFGVRVGSSSRDELGQSSLRGSVQSKRVLPNDR